MYAATAAAARTVTAFFCLCVAPVWRQFVGHQQRADGNVICAYRGRSSSFLLLLSLQVTRLKHTGKLRSSVNNR